jgi:hypothetical protein
VVSATSTDAAKVLKGSKAASMARHHNVADGGIDSGPGGFARHGKGEDATKIFETAQAVSASAA